MNARKKAPIDEDGDTDGLVESAVVPPTNEPDEPKVATIPPKTDDTVWNLAKEFCTLNRLLRIEVESPSGRLVTYKDPALYLEAFAEEIVYRIEQSVKRRSRQ